VLLGGEVDTSYCGTRVLDTPTDLLELPSRGRNFVLVCLFEFVLTAARYVRIQRSFWQVLFYSFCLSRWNNLSQSIALLPLSFFTLLF